MRTERRGEPRCASLPRRSPEWPVRGAQEPRARHPPPPPGTPSTPQGHKRAAMGLLRAAVPQSGHVQTPILPMPWGPAARRCGVGGGRWQPPGDLLRARRGGWFCGPCDWTLKVLWFLTGLGPNATRWRTCGPTVRGCVAGSRWQLTPRRAVGLDQAPPSPVGQPVGGAAVGTGPVALGPVGGPAPCAAALRRRRRGVTLPPCGHSALGGAVAIRGGAR